MIGETKDEKFCIFSVIGFIFCSFGSRGQMLTAWRSGFLTVWSCWRHKFFRLPSAHGMIGMLSRVWDILDGIMYLSTLETFRDPRSPSWFLSFCLETRKLEKLFRKTIHNDNDGFPYIMAWPPSLVRNNLSPWLWGYHVWNLVLVWSHRRKMEIEMINLILLSSYHQCCLDLFYINALLIEF